MSTAVHLFFFKINRIICRFRFLQFTNPLNLDPVQDPMTTTTKVSDADDVLHVSAIAGTSTACKSTTK